MRSHCGSDDREAHQTDHGHSRATRHGFLWRWFLANSILGGLFALVWLILRSGSKPSRFTYPCQQAALSAATLAFGVPVVSAIVSARRRLAVALRTPGGVAVGALGLVCTVGLWAHFSRADAYAGPVLPPRGDYRAQVYHVEDCPQDPIGDRFVGLDNLLTLMGREGLKFYLSSTEALLSGPDGIIAADDVVVIKINYQWPERGGTNTDVLRGLIRRLVDHPDTFTGEIVVCENSQFNSINNFNRSQNNAEDHGQSPRDVVLGFQSQGYNVSTYDWTVRRYTLVSEYSTGNMTDGYIVYTYDSQLHGRISYPKFRTNYGTYISLKYGLWDPGSSTYDREGLKFINLPVLKSHSATYGATACVKHYMGVVTGELGTSSHSAIYYGLLGGVIAEIQPADLNILDCIWINANPYDGPWTSYAGATRRDELVASVDPVAADIWAVTNILIPAFLENGYNPPWPYPSADPDLPSSMFRMYLDRSMNYILAAGYDATNDLDQIDLHTWNGYGDDDNDSDVDMIDYHALLDCFSGPVDPADRECAHFDSDGDRDVDLTDFAELEGILAGPAPF